MKLSSQKAKNPKSTDESAKKRKKEVKPILEEGDEDDSEFEQRDADINQTDEDDERLYN